MILREGWVYQYTCEKLGEIIILHLTMYFQASISLHYWLFVSINLLDSESTKHLKTNAYNSASKTPIRSYPQSRESFEETLNPMVFDLKAG